MAIRFHCPGCAQPIEVDDAWANRPVACPYCRRTVTAPAQSTLGDLSAIPTATPLGAPAGYSSAPLSGGYAPRSNPLAVVAFALTTATITMLIVNSVILSRHRAEFEEFERELTKLDAESSPIAAAMEYARAHGGEIPRWLMTFSFLNLGSILCCLAGLVCGLLALRRNARRAMAVISVLACGGIVTLGLVVTFR